MGICHRLSRPFAVTMVKIAFHDTTDTLPENTKSAWARFGARRLFHYAVDIMHQVYLSADQGRKKEWSEATFIESVGQGMKQRSHAPEPGGYILWRTDDRRFIRYEYLKAMIVDEHIAARGSLPTAAAVTSGSFVFREVEETSRDVFFKFLGPFGDKYQLNELLFGRICLCIQSKYPGHSNRNSPAWKQYYPQIQTERGINLGIFWASTNKFESAMKEFQKKFNKGMFDREACSVNLPYWRYPPDGGIYPFSYPAEVEVEMDSYLEEENSAAAIKFASKGNITESFLQWLVSLKSKYQGNEEGANKRLCLLKLANLGRQ